MSKAQGHTAIYMCNAATNLLFPSIQVWWLSLLLLLPTSEFRKTDIRVTGSRS